MGSCSTRKQKEKTAHSALSEVRKFSRHNIKQYYRFGRILGSGSFGTAKKGTDSRANHSRLKQYIRQMIGYLYQKYKMKDKFYLIQRELEILNQLDHPNIIRVYEEYEDEMYYHFVMEYCGGGDLFERVLKKGTFSEKQSHTIMTQLFSAIDYIHSLQIIHRDLKPENILFSTSENDSDIKVIDFGLSKKYKELNSNKLQRSQSKVGTPVYVAPEVLTGTQNTN